jgi:hypothetical protein
MSHPLVTRRRRIIRELARVEWAIAATQRRMVAIQQRVAVLTRTVVRAA